MAARYADDGDLAVEEEDALSLSGGGDGDAIRLRPLRHAATDNAACTMRSSDAPASSPPPGPATAAAVVVRGARKRYGTGGHWVLDGLDMTVQESSMYALLGASGCGKTTLVMSLLGLRRLDQGLARVLGWSPGHPRSGVPGPRVGFMPQDPALSENFTVAETLRYFGRLAGLPCGDIQARARALLDVLQVAALDASTVGQLSGGERQRLSLALALLHAPPLLLLDEPTAGMDPILRERVWGLLEVLTQEKRTTLLLTTHYIEEARRADKVGLMRRGRLLVEDHPNAVMRRHGCGTLEAAFLLLSQRQEAGSEVHNRKATEEEAPPTAGLSLTSLFLRRRQSTDHVTPVTGDSVSEYFGSVPSVAAVPHVPHSNVLVCVWRDWLFLIRHKWVTAYVLLLPMALLVLFEFAFGLDVKGIRLAVVNDDADCSNDLSIALGNASYPDDCKAEAARELSCKYMGLLRGLQDYVLESYPDTKAARRAVQRGHALGLLRFPTNFSWHATQRQALFTEAQAEDLDGSEVEAHLDMSDQTVASMVRMSLYDAWSLLAADIQRGCGLDSARATLPIHFMPPVYGAARPSFQDFALPGFLLLAVCFPPVFYAAVSLLDDKLSGTSDRVVAAGVTQVEMLAARALVDCGVVLAITAVAFATAFAAFSLQSRGSLLIVACLMFLQGLWGLSVGYFVAVICSSHYPATFLSTGIIFGSAFLSGTFWPAEGMHWLLRAVSAFTPMLPAARALRNVMTQGSSHAVVSLGFLGTGVWTVGLAAVTSVLTLLRKRTD